MSVDNPSVLSIRVRATILRCVDLTAAANLWRVPESENKEGKKRVKVGCLKDAKGTSVCAYLVVYPAEHASKGP